MIIPFSKRWFRRSLLKSINKLHIGSCDLFPHAGLIGIGGSRIMGGTALTKKIHLIINDAIRLVSKCGYVNRDEISDLFQLADDYVSVIDHAKKNEAIDANDAARHFYLICVVAWHICFDLDKKTGIDPESTLVPFDAALKFSEVEKCWSSDMKTMNTLLRQRLNELSKIDQ